MGAHLIMGTLTFWPNAGFHWLFETHQNWGNIRGMTRSMSGTWPGRCLPLW